MIIGATSEAIGWLGVTLGLGATFGVIGGVVAFALGGSVVLAIVAGVAVGAVTNEMIKFRPLNDAEKQLAWRVFGATLKADDVRLTNLAGLNGRAFTAPGVDGKIYCNLGSAYAAPLASAGRAYPYPGELLIHELTHAWQIGHNSFLPGLMCSGMMNQAEYVLGDNVYAYGPPGPAWNTWNLE